jgi:hypothetical protein
MRLGSTITAHVCVWLALGLCLGLGPAARVRADEAADRASEVKVGILYNLAKFVTWPAPAQPLEHFSLCLLSDPAFHELVSLRVKGKSVGSLPIQVRMVSGAGETEACNLLFVGGAHRAQLAGLRELATKRSILLVSEADSFDQEIGMINLVLADKRLQLEVDIMALTTARLEASSQLLKLAILRR